MLKTFKKAISIFVLAVFILSLVPTAVLAEEAVIKQKVIAFNDNDYADFTRTRDYRDQYLTATYYDSRDYLYVRSQYPGYVKFYLDGYEEILKNESTKLVLNFNPRSSKLGKNFDIYLANDDCDQTVFSDLSFGKANELGFHDTSRPLWYSKNDGVQITAAAFSSGELDVNTFVSVIDEAYDNSHIALWFDSTSGDTDFDVSKSNLTITYDESKIDNKAYVEEIAEKLTWDILSDDEIDSAANDLNLPSKFYGTDVTWKSSNTDIITDDGKVIGGKGTIETVTLTATLSYQGIEETAKLGTTTREFKITCCPEEAVTVYVPFTNYRYTRDNGSSLKYEEYGYRENTNRGVIYITATSAQWTGYMQLDLSPYEEILRSPSATVDLSFIVGSGNSSSCAYDFYISLAPDSADNYFVENEKLSFVKAVELGIHDDDGKPADSRPVLFERTDTTPIENGDQVKGAGNIIGLISTLNESSTNGLVTLSLHTNNSESTNLRMNSTGSHLAITYYESEIDNEAYLNSIEPSFTWENITSDAADIVVNNLPTYFKGAKVAWSSGEGVITSSGELTPVAGQITDATLTATVTYGDYSFEENFPVKVSDNGITVNDPTLTTENGIASASFSVFNRTAEDVTYKLYLATYKDDELMEVKPVDFTINKGTSATKDLNGNLGDNYTAKFFVWSADGITPVIKNK